MNSIVFITGKTFRETCNYVMKKEDRALVLDTEGVRGHDPELMARDFEFQLGFCPQKEKPVFHAALTFADDERLPDKKLVEIGREYLEKIGMANTQFAIVKHMDTSHLHLHIVANKIDNQGEIIGKGLIKKEGMRAAAELTEKHQLVASQGKNLGSINFSALREPDLRRYEIYAAIQKHLPDCESFPDLEKRLLIEGIQTRFRKDRESGKIQGISFRKDKVSFAGKVVDASCSYKKLEHTLSRQREERLEQELQYQMRQGRGLRLHF